MLGAQGSSLRFLQLGVTVICFHVLNSVLQEAVFHLPGFHHSVLLTLLQSVCIAGFAFLDLRLAKGSRLTPLRTYVVLALFSSCSLFLTNEASRLLNYPTQVLFKSSKLLVVIIVRAVVGRFITAKKGSGAVNGNSSARKIIESNRNFWRVQFIREVVSGLIIVGGIIAFTYATQASKMQGSNSKKAVDDAEDETMWGVTSILIAMLLDALLYIGQEKFCIESNKSSEAEVILYLYGFNAIYSLAANLISGGGSGGKGGNVLSSFSYIGEQPTFVMYVFAFSICNFIGTRILLKVIGEFGSSSSVVITSCRKVLTILASFVIYPKPIGVLHCVGVAGVMVGVYVFEDTRKKSSKKEKEQKAQIEKESGSGGDQQKK